MRRFSSDEIPEKLSVFVTYIDSRKSLKEDVLELNQSSGCFLRGEQGYRCHPVVRSFIRNQSDDMGDLTQYLPKLRETRLFICVMYVGMLS